MMSPPAWSTYEIKSLLNSSFKICEGPRRRWVDTIKMDILEIGWGGVDWIGLAQDRDKWRALVNSVMNLRVH
jgi:hypothetical protein